MKRNLLFKRLIAIVAVIAIGGSLNAATETLFSFTGTSYSWPLATGWTGTATGGSYIKLSPGSIVSPVYDAKSSVTFNYDIASFGSGTNTVTKIQVLDENDQLIGTEKVLSSASSSTYVKNQTVALGNISKKFKIKVYSEGDGSTIKGTRLQNISLTAEPLSLDPSVIVSNTTVNFPTIYVSTQSTIQLTIQGYNLTQPLNVGVEGTGFSVNTTSISAAEANVSKTIDAIFSPANGTVYTGKITISSSEITTPIEIILSGKGKIDYSSNPNIIFSEYFANFSEGTPNGGASATEITDINSKTTQAGWTGAKIYSAGGAIKAGTGSGLGWIQTPAIDCSASSGKIIVIFDAMAWAGDATTLKVYLDYVDNTTASTSVTIPNSGDYYMDQVVLSFTGATSNSSIRIEGNAAANSRFFVDNLIVLSDVSTGATKPSTAGAFKVSSFNGLLTVTTEEAGLVEIYNIVGGKVTERMVQAGVSTFELGRGAYLVKMNQQIVKVNN